MRRFHYVMVPLVPLLAAFVLVRGINLTGAPYLLRHLALLPCELWTHTLLACKQQNVCR